MEQRRGRRIGLAALVIALAVVGAGCIPIYRPMPNTTVVGSPPAGSQLAGCDQAGTQLVVTADTHLDPSCTYPGVRISTSNVTLDCRGARIVDPPENQSWNRGIEISAPTTTALSNVTVRNCYTEGFTNGLRVTRNGFKDLVQGQEYVNAFSGILVENSWFHESNGSGVFVDGYVTDVTLRGIEITGAGSVGVYLEAGSKGNTVEKSYIHGNGFSAETDPAGVPFDLNGQTFMYQGTGREGIAIDGSRDNVIRGNAIVGNSAGGIFLYKNCGEFATQKPNGHWVRYYGADGNLIQQNLIVAEHNGVWAGSRMAENQIFMDCSDPAYVKNSLTAYHRDYAKANTIRQNTFSGVEVGIRVEDDDNLVQGNIFNSNVSTHRAIVVGTRERLAILGEPTDGTTISDNQSNIKGNGNPYTWTHGETNTVFTNNTAGTKVATLVEGTPIPSDPFLFVKRFWLP